MSILSWLRSVTDHDVLHHTPIEFGKGEEEFLGLNMREALDAHIAWTHHIESRLNGGNLFNPDIGVIACDHMCVLGKWIHGAAKVKFGGRSEYETLKASHAEFHLAVARILNEVENGTANGVTERVKEVRRLSGNVQLDLVRLYAASSN